jgi:hypothetical protein
MDAFAQLAGVYNGASFSDLLEADRAILGEQPRKKDVGAGFK